MLDSECAALVETVRRSLKEQRDLAKRVSSAGSATALRALEEEYEASARRTRDSISRHKGAVDAVDAIGRGEPAAKALEDQVKACDERILGLIEEARSALDTIDVIASRKKEAGGPEVGE